MKKRSFILLVVCSSFLFTQVPEHILRYRNDAKGNISNRKKSVLDANTVRTVYQNNGEISDWFDGAVSAPHFEWPKGTGHRHLDGFTFMIGAKVKIVNTLGQNVSITPIETSYREEMDIDPVTREIWGIEPLPGYSNQNSTLIAISIDSSSWPLQWPTALGLSTDWNGQWFGYLGKGVKKDVLETFYVMDDSRDKEYILPPNSYYPVASDSTRGGLGMRVEVRGMQFNHSFLENVIFWIYDVYNISDRDYDSTAFGFLIDPSVGSVNNNVGFDKSSDLTYAWAPTGKGLPNNYATGYFGQAILETSGNIGLQSAYINILGNKGPTSVWPKNDGIMWSVMTGGFGDTSIVNANISAVNGIGPFSFKKWNKERLVTVMLCGEDLIGILTIKKNSLYAYQAKFIISDSIFTTVQEKSDLPLGYMISQNYPNPFNPATTIRFIIPNAENVVIKIFDELGREVSTIVDKQFSAGEHAITFNLETLSSGAYFYRFAVGTFVSTKKLILLK